VDGFFVGGRRLSNSITLIRGFLFRVVIVIALGVEVLRGIGGRLREADDGSPFCSSGGGVGVGVGVGGCGIENGEGEEGVGDGEGDGEGEGGIGEGKEND
jgi:hypothetical protein